MSWKYRGRLIAYLPTLLGVLAGFPSVTSAQLRSLTVQDSGRHSAQYPWRASQEGFSGSGHRSNHGSSSVRPAGAELSNSQQDSGVRRSSHTLTATATAWDDSQTWNLGPALVADGMERQTGSFESQPVNIPPAVDAMGWHAYDGMQILDSESRTTVAGCHTCGGMLDCICNRGGFFFDWSRAELQAGVIGFTGPGNHLTPGNTPTGKVDGGFGFQQAFNFGTHVPSLVGGQLGSQFGLRLTQSSNHGSSASSGNRNQLFLTTGLFRRVDYGVQGGMVVDYSRDDWIYRADLLQLRGELSFVLSPCHVGGFRFTNSQKTRPVASNLSGPGVPSHFALSTLDTYRFFYRVHFGEAGRSQLELLTGFSGHSHGLLGIDLRTPIRNQVGLNVTTTYLIPDSDMEPRFTGEGWNLGLNLVWTPGRRFGFDRDYYRPLLRVADNGTLFTRVH